VLYPVVALLLVANVINLGAGISAMGGALKLLVGGSALFFSVVFGLLSVVAAVFVPYRHYAQLLKWSAPGNGVGYCRRCRYLSLGQSTR
jgi:hypothetical protein